MAQSSFTIGGLIAGVAQFFIVMLFLGPVMGAAVPQPQFNAATCNPSLSHINLSSSYNQTHCFDVIFFGVVNNTRYNVTNRTESQIQLKANSNSTGFGIYSSALSSTFSAAGLIYSAFGSMYFSITNFPKLVINLMTTSSTYLPFVSVAIFSMITLIFSSYMLTIIVLKNAGIISKGDIENI